MTKKKNGFFTFIFSLIPGAGEMYMGFLKQGASLMGLFIILIVLASELGIESLVYALPVVWFYSFFHVHCLRKMTDEEFYAVEDDFLFHMGQLLDVERQNKKHRTVLAGVLLVVGVLLLCDNFSTLFRWFLPEYMRSYVYGFFRMLPQIIIGLLFVGIGIWLILGKKRELEEQDILESKVEQQEEEVKP